MYKTSKMSKLTKKIVTATMILGICVAGLVNEISAYEAYDQEAYMYGFEVDSTQYEDTVWHNTVTTNVRIDGNIVGVCTTNIGMTRAKTRTSSGHYMDQVLVRCLMKGKHPKEDYVGYAEHLTVQSTLPAGTELMAYSPEQLADSISYTVGGNIGSDKKWGVSGSVTITKDALEINSYSDTDARLYKACYDYKGKVSKI